VRHSRPPITHQERTRVAKEEKQEGRKLGKQEETYPLAPRIHSFHAFLISCFLALNPGTRSPVFRVQSGRRNWPTEFN
jgi:hypothetical protein